MTAYSDTAGHALQDDAALAAQFNGVYNLYGRRVVDALLDGLCAGTPITLDAAAHKRVAQCVAYKDGQGWAHFVACVVEVAPELLEDAARVCTVLAQVVQQLQTANRRSGSFVRAPVSFPV